MSRSEELDTRLLRFATHVRQRTDSPVTVEDGRIIIGVLPNCVILSIGEDGSVIASFHFDAHPMSVASIVLSWIECFGNKHDLKFINSFLADVNGVLVYEEEPGFDLAHIQYLRDALEDRERKIKVFVS